MSRWRTLNIEGFDAEQIPNAFDDWYTYQVDETLVVYSFNPNLSGEEAAAEIVKTGDHPVDPAVDKVFVLNCDDTSDFVRATLYRSRGVKWQGVKSGETRQGKHHFGDEDSEFLRRLPDYIDPIFGGNWRGDER